MYQVLRRGPSIEVLHQHYARASRIDEEATITARYELEIDAPVEQVWAQLGEPTGWGQWLPDVHDVRVESGVRPDGAFTWKNGKAGIRSRFAVVEPGRELTWSGVSLGARAVHRNVLEPLGPESTHVMSEESMSGPLLVLFLNQAKLEALLAAWLTALRAASLRSPAAR